MLPYDQRPIPQREPPTGIVRNRRTKCRKGKAKKEPRAVHSRGLQLALFEALLSRRLRGCRGTGAKSPEGPTPPILPNPARAICDDRHKFGALRMLPYDQRPVPQALGAL
jgi:hypothetical protein